MPVRKSFWDYFWLTKFFLKVGGILPIDGSPALWKSILTEFLAASPLFYGCYILFPEIKYILFSDYTMDDSLEAAIIVVSIVGGQFRSFFVAVNRHKITRLFSICSELWECAISTNYEITSLWAKRARFFSMAYFCAAQLAISTFVLASAIKQSSTPPNSTLKYYPFKFAEDFTESPEYEMKYTLQVIIGYVGNSFVAAADITGTFLALNMCGQISLIRSWLLEITEEELICTCKNGKIDQTVEFVLKKCILHHQVVLNFCAELEEVVCYINLAQIMTGMCALAISGARLAASLEAYRYFGPFLLSICGLFFSCWPADTLSFASGELGEAVYGVPWYRCSQRGKTAAAIMLARSQRPAQLTAGKFAALSLETFWSIVSTSLSFCMVLYNF